MPKARLQAGSMFSAGDWVTLLQTSLEAPIQGTTARCRSRGKQDTIEARTSPAVGLLHMGELSNVRLWHRGQRRRGVDRQRETDCHLGASISESNCQIKFHHPTDARGGLPGLRCLETAARAPLSSLRLEPSILPTLLRNLLGLFVMAAALGDHLLLQRSQTFQTILQCLLLFGQLGLCLQHCRLRLGRIHAFPRLSKNILVALMRSSTGRTCACSRAWRRTSFNPQSSSPNALIATSNFPTCPLASEIASSRLREALS